MNGDTVFTSSTSLRRVLLVSPVGDIGGGEEVLLALARHLPEFGYEAQIACLRPGPLEAAARDLGVFAVSGEAHRMREFGKVRAARRWLNGVVRERRPSVVHTNHMAHLYYGRGAARRDGVKEVWHIHDYPHRLDWLDRLCRLVPTDHLIFTTPFVRSGYGLLRRRFANSVIPPAAPPMPTASSGDIRARLGLPAAGPILLTATRLQAHKGHRVLLAAAKEVVGQVPATFVVTGSPSDERQAAYLAELTAVVQTLGIEDSVRFVGRVSDDDLAALYAESAALVHPAITEGFGLALVNAMRAGLPVIAADAEGPCYVLDNGKFGVLVPRQDSAALAAAILKLLRSPPDKKSLIDITAVADVRFSAKKMAEDVAKVYDSILGVPRQIAS